jgi:PAS domain S-box-containing protein
MNRRPTVTNQPILPKPVPIKVGSMENKKISVLLIEDSVDDAELIKRKLEKSANTRFQVAVARKLEDGLKQAETSEPDLIVSDLGLPDSHGLDTVTKILLAVPHVPLVVLSGFDDEDTGIRAVQSGAQDYLVKGRLDDAQLERSIYYSIERTRLQYELEQNSQEISKLHNNLLKILENSADATVVVGENGGILFTNPAVESLFGQKPKELLNQTFQYPLTGAKTSEIEIYRTDGKKTIAEMNVVNITWEGRPARLVSMHNITKRKAMEEALRTSEEKYRNIVELSHEGIIITDTEGIITSCNLTFLNMTGLSEKQIVGKHFQDIPSMKTENVPLYTEKFASLLNGKKNPPLEIPWKSKDGETRIFELSSNLMKADGNIFGIQTIVTDITERKRAEEALQELSSRQEAILGSVPDIIMEVDNDKIYTWANKAGVDFFGDDVIGKEASYYFEGEQDTYDKVKSLFNGDESVTYVESWQRRRDGEKRLLAWWCRVIKDQDGKVSGALSTARDITERRKAAEALRISEEKFSKAFLNSPEAIVISNIDDGEILEVNNTFLDFFGYSRDDVIGKKANEIKTWVNPKERTEIVKILKEKGFVRNKECLFRIKSGEIRTLLFSAEIIIIGNKSCMLSVNTDITERKQTEEALRFSDTALRSIQEGVYALDMDYRVTRWNEICEQMFGIKASDAIGKSIADLITLAEEYPGQNDKRLEILLKQGFNKEEQIYQTPKGNVWVDVQCQAMEDNGKRTGWVTLASDITERKKTEEALKQSEEKYRELINSSTDAIVSADQHMKVTIWNKGAETIFGYKEKEMLGQSVMKIVPEMIHKSMANAYIQFNKTGAHSMGNKIIEIVGVRKDGSEVPIELSISTRKAGDMYIATAIIRDITARKEAEEKLRKIDQMKSEFLSNVSHELRTPLQSISGFTKLIMTGKVPDPTTQQEFLQIIDTEISHLGNLINSLLDMSRLESGRFQIYKKNVPLCDIICDSLKTLHGLAREKNITINENVPKQLPNMELDSDRMRQVILNLVGNAIKFSESGETIDVKAGVQDGELLFQVIDHGTGIKKEDMVHLFKRFYRAEGETVRGGTGLGLYISKQIIDAHEGKIWAESKYGEGSTFSFTLPLNNKGGEKNGKENSDNRRRSGNSKTGRLLTKAGRLPGNHSL